MTISQLFDQAAFANRLKRMERHHGKWARRQGLEAFRIYERDLPDVPAIVDRYGQAIVVWLMPRKRDVSAEQQSSFDKAVLEKPVAMLA